MIWPDDPIPPSRACPASSLLDGQADSDENRWSLAGNLRIEAGGLRARKTH
jgi:hypothetical protein